ncbi:MAG: hypothetical protein ABR548_03360 [Actinomycetota bacterium]|nr:hypothetical protein [Actinomycetota bacterium]
MRKASVIPVVALLGALFMVLPQHGPGHRVIMRDFRFAPFDVMVDRGDAVSFRNDSSHTHTATCVQCPVSLDTGDVQPGQVKSLTFPKNGTYIFVSSYDQDRQMAIRVRVGPAAPSPGPSASPSPSPVAT